MKRKNGITKNEKMRVCFIRLSKSVWQGHKDSNPGHVVLETTALPTELYPYTTGERFTNRFTRYGGEDGIRTHAALNEP